MTVDADLQARRTDAIQRLRLLDKVGDPGLAGLSRVAAYVTGAHSAAVHIIGDRLQTRIAAVNAELGTHPRGDSMCSLSVDQDTTVHTEDATNDPRFSYSSFVTGETPVRFFASVPLRTSDAVPVGTLCAFDSVPRRLSDDQLSALEDLATQAISLVELARLAVDLGHAASHDPLTGAANRLLLTDRIEHALARSRRHGGHAFLAVVDLDDFKGINDVYGHAVGDSVLSTIARRFMHIGRAMDTVARTGGDEFAFVAEDIADEQAAEVLAGRLRAAFDEPFDVAGKPITLRGSLDYTLSAPGDDPAGLLERADAAMYARKRGRG